MGSADHPALFAVEAVARLAASEELQHVVGCKDALALQRRASIAASKLGAPPEEAAESVCDLGRECIGLAAAVEVSFNSADAPPAERTDEWDWEFGVAVAQAIAYGLAAAALTLAPSGSGQALELLEELGRELDFLSAYLFGGLCRLEMQGWSTQREGRLHWALKSTCAWALEAVAKVVGHSGLSAAVLWEFASHDAVWALSLAKGVLIASTTAQEEPPLPAQLELLQRAVLQAVLGLAAPAVAFLAEPHSDDLSILERNKRLVRHRAVLAGALMDCHACGALVHASAHFGSAADLATFLLNLLQPEPAEDLDEADETLCAGLRPHASALWALLTSTLVASGPGRRCFLRECASLAHFLPPDGDASDCMLALHGEAKVEPAALAALCVLAANSGKGPGSTGLAQAVTAAPACEQALIAAQWAKWKGPVKVAVLWRWQQLLTAAPAEAQAEAETEQPPPSAQARLAPRRASAAPLRVLLDDAPAEFRCALDGQLMLDPVRTPFGYVFERMGLVCAMQSSGGMCPLTGQVLTLEECVRLPELRRRIARWVREQHLPCES